MSKPINKIHNAETGEILEVEMTDEEYEIYLANKAEDEARLEATENAKKIAETKLKALGLTPEDLKALGLA